MCNRATPSTYSAPVLVDNAIPLLSRLELRSSTLFAALKLQPPSTLAVSVASLSVVPHRTIDYIVARDVKESADDQLEDRGLDHLHLKTINDFVAAFDAARGKVPDGASGTSSTSAVPVSAGVALKSALSEVRSWLPRLPTGHSDASALVGLVPNLDLLEMYKEAPKLITNLRRREVYKRDQPSRSSASRLLYQQNKTQSSKFLLSASSSASSSGGRKSKHTAEEVRAARALIKSSEILQDNLGRVYAGRVSSTLFRPTRKQRRS